MQAISPTTAPALVAALSRRVRAIPDFPRPGIVFRDVTPLLADPETLARAVDALAAPFRGGAISVVAGTEARGFIFGAMVAAHLGAGFVPLRKPGKLPYRTERADYALEYGESALEIHADAIAAGDRVLVVDDLIATGGTARASCDLVARLGGQVAGCAFLIELEALGGRGQLAATPVHAVLRY